VVVCPGSGDAKRQGQITVNIFANIEDELERDQRISVLFILAVSEPTTVKPHNGSRKGK
jgi:hypothetical protein